MKTTITIIITLLGTLTFGQTKDKYQKYYDSLIVRGRYDELIIFLEKELKNYPKSEDILRSIGYVHIAKKNLDLGEKYYLQALDLNPQCARCYLNIGIVYSLRGDNKKALEYFDQAINIDSKDAILYSTRARLKEILGDKFGAFSDHDKAIEIDPNNPEYLVQRGLYNSNSGFQSLAISDFTNAIELSPNNYNPYFERANIYFNQKKYNEALADVNKAIELDSSQHSLYTGRGAIFNALQEYNRAIDDYTKAISLNSDDFFPYLKRANSFYNLEELDSSCTDFAILKTKIENGSITDQVIIEEVNNAILDICDATQPSFYYQRGIGYYNLQEYNMALEMYEKGLAIFPNNSMMLTFKGNAHLALNEYEKAINFYSLSLKHKENLLAELKINPKFANTSNEQIVSFYNGALASTYLSLSECKVYLGQFDGALADINTALELAPDLKDFNKERYYNLRGQIYLMNGKFEEAMSDFNKSIEINKSFPIAYVNRAIAKVSLAEKVQISTYSVRGNISNQPMRVDWNLPNKSSLKKSETKILSALSDCNLAIEMDKKLGFAYYIRGQIKQMLLHGEYCMDLLTARGLGLSVEEELLRNCGN